jgi:hypothetical protein
MLRRYHKRLAIEKVPFMRAPRFNSSFTSKTPCVAATRSAVPALVQ